MALGDEHLPIRLRCHARVPALVLHVGGPGPRVRGGVEDVGCPDPGEVWPSFAVVSARGEDPAIHQVGQAAAEEVHTGRRVHRREAAVSGVPDGGSREGVIAVRGVSIGLVLRNARVVREDLAVRKQRYVDRYDRPVDEVAPAAYLGGVVRNVRCCVRGVIGRECVGLGLHPPFLTGGEGDGVLLHVLLDRVHGTCQVVPERPGRRDQHDEGRRSGGKEEPVSTE